MRGAWRGLVVRDLRVRVASTVEALHNRDLALLLAVWGVWVTTDWALLITVSLLAFEDHGPAAVGVIGAVRVLPAAVLTGPLSVLTDRWSRGGLLAVVCVGWAALAGVLAWCAEVRAPLTVLLAVVGLGAALGALVKPTVQAMVPTLVGTPSQLITANSAHATIQALGTVLGPAICAAALTVIHPEGVFVVVAALFVVATVAALAIRTPYQPAVHHTAGQRRNWLAPLRGFAVVFGRDVRLTSVLMLAQTMVRGLLNVFVVLVAAAVAEDSEAFTGAAFMAMGFGGLAGAVVAASMSRSRRSARWMAVGVTAWGLPIVVIGVWTGPGVTLVALATIGLGNAVLNVFAFSLLNRMFPDHVAGRAWGAFHAGSAAAIALGSLLAPVLTSAMGLEGAMVLTGALLTAAPWLAWPWLRRVDGRAAGRGEDLDLLRRVPILAPMSLIGLERLARVSQPVELLAGETVVREGEPADCFYVVAAGSLSVSQKGEPVRSLGPDASFGEVGLLRGSPRSATVVAERPSRVLRIDGGGFVAAVTGHRPTDEAVRGTVAAYLSEDGRRRRDLG